MKKTNYLYLCMAIAFVVIFFITLFIGIEPKIIIGYSLSIFFFSIIDLVNTVTGGRQVIKEIKNDSIGNDIEDLINAMRQEMEVSINGLIQTADQINTARTDLLNNIMNDSLVIERTQKDVINKPTQSILHTSKKQSEIGNNVIDKVFTSFEKIKPDETVTLTDRINIILSIFAITLIIVVPLLPNEYITWVPLGLSEFGILLTILGLSLLFLTSFIKNYNQEKLDKLRHEYYHKLSSGLGNVKNVMLTRELVVEQQSKQVMNELNDIGKLMGIGIERAIHRGIEFSTEKNKKEA